MTAEDAIIYKLLENINVDANGCFNWQKYCGNHGYGLTSYKNKVYTTHRLSFELFRSPIPAGLFVCHRCDNRRCINPSHLFLGTQKDNMQDAVKKGRASRPPRSTQKLTPEKVFAIAERYADGASSRELAIEFGVTRRNILDICSGGTWPEVQRRTTKCRTTASKLTDSQVLEIRRRRLDGEQFKAIAKDYDLTAQYVWAICKGRALKHIR